MLAGSSRRTGGEEGLLGKCRNGGRLIAGGVDELVVDNFNLAVITRELNNLVGDGLSIGKGGNVLADAGEVENDVLGVGSGQLGPALLAKDHEVEVGIRESLATNIAGKTRVNTAAETLVGAADDDELLLALGLGGLRLGRRVHLVASLAVLARLGHAALGACELGRGHNLHRLGDLLDVANRLEAALNFTEGREVGRGARRSCHSGGGGSSGSQSRSGSSGQHCEKV
jgi:hypothetical protein